MKGLGRVFLAYFLWLPPLRWGAGLGWTLLVLAPSAALVDRRLAFGMAIWGFIAGLAVPALLAPIAFRTLISNARLSLLPGFHAAAGVALLLLNLLFSACIPLYAQLTGAPVSPRFFAYQFIAGSLYTGLLQLVLPSRHMVAVFSFLPAVLIVTWSRFGELLRPLFLDPSFLLAMLALCAAGWTWGLAVLRRPGASFRPMNRPYNHEDWFYLDFGWANRRGLGKVRTPAGTLLMGYPDSLGSQFIRVLNFTLLSPLLCLAVLYLLGPIRGGENPVLGNPPATFLAFALFTSLLFTWNFPEMVGRCRLLWLRQGTGRQAQWRLMEALILRNLALLYGVMGLTALLLAFLFPSLPAGFGTHVMAILITRTLFDVYFNLLGRVRHWSTLFTGFLSVVSAAPLLYAAARAAFFGDPLPLVAMEGAQMALAVLFREAARRGFRRIDWRRVTPRMPGRARGEPAPS